MKKTPTPIEKVKSALSHLPSDLFRDEWVHVAMALKSEGCEYDLFRDWSSTSSNFNEQDCASVWRSCKTNGAGPSITIGTLFHLAKKYGWQYKQPNSSQFLSPKTAPEPHSSKTSVYDPNQIWSRCEPASDEHPYVIEKEGQGAPLDSLRVVPENDTLSIAGRSMVGALVVPCMSIDGEIVSLQFILPPVAKVVGKPSKLNLPDHSMTGFFNVGQLQDGCTVYVVEGIGQAWACWLATGSPAAVCFGAGNMARVANTLHERYPACQLVIVSDVGKESQAIQIATSVEGLVATMPDDWEKNDDVNDCLKRDGKAALGALLENALSPPKPLALPKITHVQALDYDLLQIESHGDIRNAKAFASLASGELIYVTTRGRWLKWDKTRRWILCEKEEEVAFAKMCCARILGAASSIFGQDHERGKKMISQAITAHNLPRIQAMLRLAISEPDMAVTDRELDTNPYQLGVLNGVVNLKTGEHIDNQPHYYITRYCNANFEDDAVCPNWIRFLYQIFEEDEATIESVQLLLGYTLTGLVTEEIAVICYGVGSNGKSVFGNVINQILGGYSTTAASTVLTTRRSDDASPRNDLAALAGARYVSINELQAGDRLDEQVVKMIAGREPISARFLHKEFFEYMPTFTAWLRTNHKPIVTGEDDGIWRRLVLLRFNRKFSDGEKDPNLEEKLLAESQGILQWMLEGARKYFADGLRLSPRILHEHAKYRTESDLLGEFLADVMQADANAKINQNTAYEAWTNWCKLNGFRLSTKKSFTQRLAERGFPDGKSGSNRFYVGLKLQVDNTYS